jgi:CRISPR-associated protein Cmr4
MYKKIRPLFLICETPMHAGSGSDLGIVDLPIQRERHTGYPEVESSSLKGSLRMAFEESEDNGKKYNDSNICHTFGPKEGDYASSLGFTNAEILLFPVKSMKGIYAWITCENVLDKFRSNLRYCGIDMPPLPGKGSIPQDTDLATKTKSGDSKIALEEYAFDVEKSKECSDLAEWMSEIIFPKDAIFNYRRDKLKKDMVVLDDDEFRDFVNMSTEVVTRTKINVCTGTVQKGALFTEEYLPAESILYSLVMSSSIHNKDEKETEKGIFKSKSSKEEDISMEFFQNYLPGTVQIGGDATIGKGIVTTNVYGGEK